MRLLRGTLADILTFSVRIGGYGFGFGPRGGIEFYGFSYGGANANGHGMGCSDDVVEEAT